MRGWLPISVLLGTLLLSPPALGDAAAQCAAIPDRAARLQCFTSVSAITAKVGRVVDGDTMDICIGARCIRVRLCGINAPERGAPGGAEATEALRSLASRETVRCVPVGQGTVCDGRSRSTNRGRLVAQCFLGGVDIGGVMVEQGLACDWERFSGGHYSRKGGRAARSSASSPALAFEDKLDVELVLRIVAALGSKRTKTRLRSALA